MFRRSILQIGTFVLISLTLTLGYVVIFFDGAGDLIRTARARFDRGEYLRVIADLTLNERSASLRGDPSKRRALYDLRYRANLALGNYRAALNDLDQLMTEVGTPDEQMRLDHIRLLAHAGQGELARQEAEAFLESQPDHGPALELAGEACQTAYREELQSLRAAIELDVGAAIARDRAMPALLTYLYRPDEDAEVRHAMATLQLVYSTQSQALAAWPARQHRLELLRARIQEALTYFQRSLESGGEPVAAFLGLALSLEQSERLDDLMSLCECYRRRFDHQYVAEAGSIAAWSLLGRGLDTAAQETILRWIPPAKIREMSTGEGLGHAVADLLLAQVLLAWNTRDVNEMQKLWASINALRKTGLPMQLPIALFQGLQDWLRDDEACLRTLQWTMSLVTRTPTPHGQQDLLSVIVPARVDWMQRHGYPDADILKDFRSWRYARPTSLEPLLALAEYQIATSSFAGARKSLLEATKLSSDDEHEELLAMRTRVAAELYLDTNQDGSGLLLQCLQQRRLVPDQVPDPVCYLLCGEAALTAGGEAALAVALACAHAATDAMPGSNAGRMLEVRTLLRAGRTAEAVELVRPMVSEGRPSEELLRLALEVFSAAAEPTDELLWLALSRLPADPTILGEALCHAAQEAPSAALPYARRALGFAEVPPRTSLLAAAAFARLGERETAERILRSLPPEARSDPANGELLGLAVTELIRCAARTGVSDDELAARIPERIAEFGLDAQPSAPAMLACAEALEASHPKTAWHLLTPAIAAAAAEDRTGSAFARMARLTLANGLTTLAEQHATAAIAFPDGRQVAELLARMCLATGRPEHAERIYRLVEQPSDSALALRFGSAEAGKALAQASLAHDPEDLLANVALAAASEASLTPALAPETESDRNELLEVIAVLRTPELAAAVLPRVIELAKALPAPGMRLLLARAHLHGGEPAEAARIHAELLAEGLDTALFWREVSEAACLADYEPAEAVATAFGAAAVAGEFAATPFTFAVAMMRAADLLDRDGRSPATSASLRTLVWKDFDADRPFPKRYLPTLAQVDALTATGKPADRWTVLSRLLPTLQGEERAACVERMLAISMLEDTFEPYVQEAIHDALFAIGASDAPRGRLVHHLLALAETDPTRAFSEEQRLALLRGHLELVATGRDRADEIAMTSDGLCALQGTPATLETIESMLREHPTAVALWVERARLLSSVGRTDEGITALRTVLTHADAPAARLECIRAAAAHFALVDQDIAWLAELPPELRASEGGLLAQGLVALRTGKPERAVTLLTRAEPAGGAHRLAALAQALLQSDSDDGVERAVRVLEKLTAEHPTSSEARYATSFIRLLTAE